MTRILLGGAPEGYDAKLLAREAERGEPVIHIARDDRRAEAMRAALAAILGVETHRISVKATTSEKLGFTGREEGIAALATVTLVKS